jgi:hypothetical protein
VRLIRFIALQVEADPVPVLDKTSTARTDTGNRFCLSQAIGRMIRFSGNVLFSDMQIEAHSFRHRIKMES